jgi:cobalt/nickel transport system permease protein
MVQALFFADGGLLALGCNIFNLGVFPAFIAFPFIYKKLVGPQPRQARMVASAIFSAVIALQLGSFGVVLQTVLSGVSVLPFDTFLLLMQPIHLGIGIVEGVVTALIVSFIYKARPDVLESSLYNRPVGELPTKSLTASLLVAALLIGGILSWYASEHPDGLEWSIAKVTGGEELENQESKPHEQLGHLQEKTAVLPDYALPAQDNDPTVAEARAETSLAGIIGGLITLALCTAIGYFLKKRAPAKLSQTTNNGAR